LKKYDPHSRRNSKLISGGEKKMLSRNKLFALCYRILSKRLTVILGLAFMLVCIAPKLHAQCPFNSGSTGADGAFAPTKSQDVQVPESGVFNFTTVTIPSGVTITFIRNSRNTPVTILAQGNVTINGRFDVSGKPGGTGRFQFGRGGPGGFDGGGGGFMGISTDPFFPGISGDGPGGGGGATGLGPCCNNYHGGGGGHADAGSPGSVSNNNGGPRYGSPTLLPLIGGSGGGGSAASNGVAGGSGGGGGGTILIASSGTINFSGSERGILATGGDGGAFTSFCGGGGGAGGAIRLVANTLTGSAVLLAGGGLTNCGLPGRGGRGYIRIEACTNSLTFSNSSGYVSYSRPGSVTLPNAPQLSITSIAGINAPTNPSGSFNGTPDVVLPASTTNPVNMALQAANVPVGTVVQVSLQPESGTRTNVQSTPLAGTTASSTATASVTLPVGLSLITAIAEFDVTPLALFIDGERVKRVEMRATYGGRSEVTYITSSGKRFLTQ
jgi:hypothetical protein